MEFNGILPLHKPKGMTSHDCVFRLRKLLKTKKVGHTGTLDPDVTGVLPICIGKGTKVAEYMTDYPKEYVGEVTLGWSTTTEDSSGEIVEKKSVDTPPTVEQVKKILQSFTGEIDQVPPMYSAVKVKGKKLYEYARAGIEVERPVRRVNIYELQLVENEINTSDNTASFSFRVKCSKGTYVRTLAVDIGKELGYPAHMSYLQRIASGPFQLSDCYTFEQLEEMVEKHEIENVLLPIEEAIKHFPSAVVDSQTEAKIKNGSVLPQFKSIDENRFSVYNEDGVCLAIYQQHPTKQGLIKPEKMFS
ncbi:tRNA pseudouridine(55) synthase TruB [Alkalihalobacterium chitinilyticum]|uniref:tRNA pseudouridine synthase B n=1 Tax=Alkalihalobacterium chitinilyticum TaxID=2980103 RepID=A0ABT5VCM5_9BACI|nr:tRNA pseudouridine(55) synthase TruB [Alkalihalobacterium chitinilyticum]MDE5412921.1 tRNA pseudouridine(55) synthase TruB [Alkalihalobacterium chitinilyticum]